MPSVIAKSPPLGNTAGHTDGLILPTDSNWIGSSAIALTSGTRYMGRFAPERSFTSSAFRFRLLTQSGTNDPVEIVVHDQDGVFIASSGSVSAKLNAGNNTNQEVTLAQYFRQGGVYYVGLVATSTATILMATYGSAALPSIWGAAPPHSQALSKASVGIGDTATMSGYSASLYAPAMIALF